MTIHPARLARIRAHSDHANRLASYRMRPSNDEVADIIADLNDMLADYTNTHRGL